jgi:hypothetical protein
LNVYTRPSCGAVRRARWPELHVRLWCFSEQAFKPWVRDRFDNIICGSCARLLISERGD